MTGSISAGSDRALCTIVAKNYVAFARTLCRSYLAAHPGGRCFVLVVDESAGFIDPTAEPFELVALDVLGIPDLQTFRFKYHITELCTAAKPFLLAWLLQKRGVGRLVYLDPDILVTNPIDGLFDRLGRHPVVVTPHTTKDFPRDGLEPDHTTVYSTGLMNLGFVGVNGSDEGIRFLRWWQEKVEDHCVVDWRAGYFFDQKFVDFALLLFADVHVERDAGYNAAFWNLHERTLHRAGGTWRCNDGPLYFFHFSGYRLHESKQISHYFPLDRSRYTLTNRPDLQPLFTDYADMVVANGHAEASRWPYSYGTVASGEPIPFEWRVLYRGALPELAPLGDPFASPEVARRLKDMHHATTRGGRLRRITMTLYRRTPFLRPAVRRWVKGSGVGRGIIRLFARVAGEGTSGLRER